MSLPASLLLRLLQWGVNPFAADTDSDVESESGAVAPLLPADEEEEDTCDAREPTPAPEEPSVWGGRGPLRACVSISSPYTRGLLLQAMARRSNLWRFVVNDSDEPPSEAEAAAAATTAAEAADSAKVVVIPAQTPSAASDPWSLNLHFCEFERIDWGRSLSSHVAGDLLLLSSYPVRKGLIRKAQLSFTLKKFMAKRPNSILHKTFPETHIMQIDDPVYLEEALNDVYEMRDMVEGVDMWIMKASMVNQAQGIHVIRSLADVEAVINDPRNEDMKEWVAQRYVQRPMLVDGCKFHVRAYVLAVGNLRVYMWDQMLVLIAMDKYQRDVVTRSSHITNTCANSDHPDFEEAKQIRLLSEILPAEQLASTLEQMRLTLHDVFVALHGEPTVFLPVPHAFELYGVDFLLDEDGGVWFLEANAGPDFAMTGERLQGVVKGLMEHTLRLAVDAPMEAHCKKSDVDVPARTVQEQAEWDKAEAELKGSFIPCYEHINEQRVTMSFY